MFDKKILFIVFRMSLLKNDLSTQNGTNKAWSPFVKVIKTTIFQNQLKESPYSVIFLIIWFLFAGPSASTEDEAGEAAFDL